MTEAEWNACAAPAPMLAFLRGKASERKLRLIAVACCRQIWDRLEHPSGQTALETAERFADGGVTAEELERARRRHRESGAYKKQRNAANAVSGAALIMSRSRIVSLEAALLAAQNAAKAATDKPGGGDRSYKDPEWLPRWKAARVTQTAILRDIVGDPFRPASVANSWLTWKDGAIHKMAQSIYTERAFDRLPLLADALEDAGCADASLLDHLRGPGPHVRGCHVLDAILGRS